MPTMDRISFDTGVSGTVQSDIGGIVSHLESLISQRDAQVAAAMADFQADGVSDQYHAVEVRWKNASQEVRTIIELVKTTMARNDETATGAQTRARTAVESIG